MTGFFLRVFSLLWASEIFFFPAWLEGINSLLVQDSFFRFFTRSLGHSVHTSCHPSCYPKTDFLIPISADEKGATSALEYWPIIWPLSSSFTLSGNSFGLLYVHIPPSLSIQAQSANICWLSFWPGFVTSAARNWPTFLFSF